MKRISPEKIDTWVRIALFLLIVVVLVLCAVLLNEYARLRRADALQAHVSALVALEHRGTPLSDPSQIQAWMTFDYVNHLYNLPPTYLQTTLSISDPHYPRISITQFGHDEHASSTPALSEVRLAVGAYLSGQN